MIRQILVGANNFKFNIKSAKFGCKQRNDQLMTLPPMKNNSKYSYLFPAAVMIMEEFSLQ